MKNKINKLYRRALRVVQKVNQSSPKELISRDELVYIQHHNLEVLATNMY